MDLRDLAKQEFKRLDSKDELTDREKVCKEALSHVGYTEGENNDNMFGHYFDFNNVAWCGFFCNYCYVVGSAIFLPDTNKGKQGLAYVPKAYQMFKDLGCLTDEPKEGDLVIFDFPKGVKGDHIGIFYGEVENNYFYAIEGNTSLKGHQSNGGAVEFQKRSKSLVLGFVSLEKIKELKLMP